MNRRACLVLLALAFFVVASGCSRCSKEGAPGGPAASALPPIPAPAGLLADVAAPAPDATWTKVRGVIGEPAAFLPQSFGGLVATLLGLPMTVAGEFDGNVPVLGAIAEGPQPNQPRAALALHVKAGDRFVDQLTKGEGARFVTKQDPTSLVTLLEPKADKAAASYAVGVLSNYLLLARTADDLIALGPYVVRTLSTKPPPQEDIAIDIPQAALAGPVQTLLKQLTLQLDAIAQRSGAPAGGPMAATLAQSMAILGDSARARATVVLDPTSVRARVTVVPKPGNGAAAETAAKLMTGDAHRILELPKDAVVSATWYDAPATRATQGASYAAALVAMLGKDVSASDRETIQRAFTVLAEARGDWASVGLAFGPEGFSGFLRAAVADAEKAQLAMKSVVKMADLPSVKAGLKEAGLAMTPGKMKVDGVSGEVQRVHVDSVPEAKIGAAKGSAPAAMGMLPTSLDLVYVVTTELLAAVGTDPKPALLAVVEAPSKNNLGEVPEVRAAVTTLGNAVSFAVVLEPLKVVAMGAGKPAPAAAPVVLALGKEGTPSELWVRLDIANAAIQEIIRTRGAF
jgi:hypothetical protein